MRMAAALQRGLKPVGTRGRVDCVEWDAAGRASGGLGRCLILPRPFRLVADSYRAWAVLIIVSPAL